ncbi:transposase [Pseudomonas sp. TH39(2020)]|uniref:transposase n=1 Tax=Pseudomonas sp. TH39(2020) TaxID=2796349 RepID=UPI0019141CA4|nr:transposase [Pseudomonas sp. TH39(2020)]MBK5397476.1 transposase [Pseudomonas sp. TH39(2020)]
MRQRTSYSKPFKAKVDEECLQPSVSMASVALRHGINANLVRKWIPAYRDRQPPALPAFVPLHMARHHPWICAPVLRLRQPE